MKIIRFGEWAQINLLKDFFNLYIDNILNY